MSGYIVHISTVHSPFDTRIFQKDCRTLAEAGYRIALPVPHTCRETVNGVEIIPPNSANRCRRTRWPATSPPPTWA